MESLLVLLMAVVSYHGQIVVSDRVPPPVRYPAEVYRMSDEEFYKWATDFNKKQVADMEARREKITEEKWISGTVTTSSQTSYSAYGCGPYGCGPYGCNSYGCGSYGCGYRGYLGYYGPYDNGYYGGSSEQSVTYPMRWPNPACFGPGPLTIINPYCRPRN